MAYVIHALFFFSSRRRHTRYIGDWSSDVCSSDLRRRFPIPFFSSAVAKKWVTESAEGCKKMRSWIYRNSRARSAISARSEERRVGKECRSRWGARDYNTKREDMMR